MKNVSNPIFKKTVVDFDEELLVIKQQLLDEDNKEKCESSSPIVEEEVKANTNAGSSENEKLKAKKKKQIEMEKLALTKAITMPM